MEFQPFDENKLVKYLRNINKLKIHLADQQKLLDAQMKLLCCHKMTEEETDWSIEELIVEYAFKSRDDGEACGGGAPNPDMLFNQWLDVYGSYETKRESVIRDMDKIKMEQKQLDCIMQCIYSLYPDEKNIIEQVYIGRQKVNDYCSTHQIGHDTYRLTKNNALRHLRKSCNTKLEILFDEVNSSEKDNKKYSIVISDSDHNGRNIYGTVSIRRIHGRAKSVPENTDRFHIWKEKQ